MEYEDRCKGAFLGLAVGDALGTTLEFERRDTYDHITDIVGGGPFEMNPGEWTDDTSMALCLAESIVDKGEIDPDDIMWGFYRWMRYGHNSVKGYCFDIGGTTANAIRNWKRNRSLINNRIESKSGNGGIMRIAPAIIAGWRNYDDAISNAVSSSEITHASGTCTQCAAYMAGYMYNLFRGQDQKPVSDDARFVALTNTDFTKVKRSDIKSSGYALHTLEAAIWSLENTSNFKDAVLLAANLGDDADTVAAVTGQLAGAKYGKSGIPEKWLECLYTGEYIEELAERLYEMGKE